MIDKLNPDEVQMLVHLVQRFFTAVQDGNREPQVIYRDVAGAQYVHRAHEVRGAVIKDGKLYLRISGKAPPPTTHELGVEVHAEDVAGVLDFFPAPFGKELYPELQPDEEAPAGETAKAA